MVRDKPITGVPPQRWPFVGFCSADCENMTLPRHECCLCRVPVTRRGCVIQPRFWFLLQDVKWVSNVSSVKDNSWLADSFSSFLGAEETVSGGRILVASSIAVCNKERGSSSVRKTRRRPGTYSGGDKNDSFSVSYISPAGRFSFDYAAAVSQRGQQAST